MKNICKIIFLALIYTSLISCLTQKEKEENKKVYAKMIKANHFKFIAQQAIPMRMPVFQLTSDYSLSISKDTIDCYLPYFGVATMAPYGSTNNGIQFISTKFSYDKQSKKNGSYEITIIPKDTDKASKLYLTISETGYASLNVTSTFRDPITFNGIIVKK